MIPGTHSSFVNSRITSLIKRLFWVIKNDSIRLCGLQKFCEKLDLTWGGFFWNTLYICFFGESSCLNICLLSYEKIEFIGVNCLFKHIKKINQQQARFYFYGSRTIAPEENCPPIPNTNPNPNPNPNRGAIFLEGNYSDTYFYKFWYWIPPEIFPCE